MGQREEVKGVPVITAGVSDMMLYDITVIAIHSTPLPVSRREFRIPETSMTCGSTRHDHSGMERKKAGCAMCPGEYGNQERISKQ